MTRLLPVILLSLVVAISGCAMSVTLVHGDNNKSTTSMTLGLDGAASNTRTSAANEDAVPVVDDDDDTAMRPLGPIGNQQRPVMLIPPLPPRTRPSSEGLPSVDLADLGRE